jgi:hypothetical protein
MDAAGESAFALMSLAGDSSLTTSGAIRARNLSGETLRVTIKVALVLDFRRASEDLAGGAIVVDDRDLVELLMMVMVEGWFVDNKSRCGVALRCDGRNSDTTGDDEKNGKGAGF